jgi:hypothetical protein
VAAKNDASTQGPVPMTLSAQTSRDLDHVNMPKIQFIKKVQGNKCSGLHTFLLNSCFCFS